MARALVGQVLDFKVSLNLSVFTLTPFIPLLSDLEAHAFFWGPFVIANAGGKTAGQRGSD